MTIQPIFAALLNGPATLARQMNVMLANRTDNNATTDMPLTLNRDHVVRPIALGLLLAITPITRLFGQTWTIAEGSITTCVGALLDSGGEGAAGYSPNENYTATICSDQPGLAISLQWISFNLSTEGSDPVDQLTIYDGPDNTAPVIGTYTGSNSPGIVTASFGNTSGCLTLNFTSNELGEGLFSAVITCFQPCEPPFAIASMSEAAPALICQGEVVGFDASASTAAQGFNIIEYQWQFGDGSVDSTTGPVISHAFEEPGEYIVQVLLTDDNECNNDNYIDLAVRVSTDPVFNLSSDTSVCLGNLAALVGDVTPTTWNELPSADFGAGIFLPDDLGIPFTSELNYNGVFEPGAVLTDIDQLQTLCVSMEHSYMGDFVVQITCPSGQTVTLHEQGGGGTYLGEPIDDESQPLVQGICYEYCWSASATNGTWEENSGGGTLPAGTYESVQPMSNLIGCPLNGAWTLTITDLFAIDNGFLCAWSMDFDPALFPDLTTYTPDLGLESPDSAFWSGPGFVVDPNDHLSGSVTPTSPGTSTYIFTVIDNFGCTYQDSMTVSASGPLAQYEVVPSSPQPIGVIAQFTDTSIPNGTTVTGWSWDFGPDLPGSTDQNPTMVFPEPGTYPVTLTITSVDGCQSSVTYDYVIIPSDVVIPNVFSPDGDEYNEALEFENAQFYNNNHLQVYNRWGQMIYESLNYRNTWRPRDVPEGTYYFIFAMADGREWAGHVTLLRKN